MLFSSKRNLIYRISSYSFRGNYSFLNLEIQRSQYIRPKVTVHIYGETIQGRKLFKGGNCMRKYGNWENKQLAVVKPFVMANQGNFGNKILWGTFVCQSEGRKKFLSSAYWPSHSMYYFQNCLNFQTDYTITYYHIMLKVRYSQKKYWHYYNCPKNVLRCILSFV